MKKKVYAKPTLIGEEFVPNEYVAACENPTSYVGYCDISAWYIWIQMKINNMIRELTNMNISILLAMKNMNLQQNLI